jgi:hypothetical protein
MVVKAAVEPGMNRVKRPALTPVSFTCSWTGAVRSKISVPAVVLDPDGASEQQV